MRVFVTLVRRELGAYFNTFNGYLIISGVLFLMGLSYSLLLKSLNGEPFDQPITEVFYTRGLFWLILLIASPLITMRTFAHEKHTGTFETLMTTPVHDFEVVMAKWASTMLFHLLVWLPILGYPFILSHYSSETISVPLGPMASTLLGILLLGGLYMSMGCFASSISRNQVVAALLAFGIGMVLFLTGMLSFLDLPRNSWQYQAIEHISMFEHMRDFSRGIVDTRHIVFYLTLTWFFLYLNFKSVESRRWK